MERIDCIIKSKKFRKHMKRIDKYEKKRIYCGHGMEHILAVARILWIINLEDDMNIPKDICYAAAFLHDIGRWKQYKDGTPHEEASVKFAPVILKKAGYLEDEIDWIIQAIGKHREKETVENKSLEGALYRADKLSRECYICKAEEECNWEKGKKNKRVKY